MGAFFTSVHVRASDPTPIVEALTEDARAQGLAETEEEPDRTIVVLTGDGWISIYDEATEGQDTRALERLAIVASQASRAPAISILVHDSDVLDLRLVRDGARIDHYDSHPGYFGEKVTKKEREAVAGRPAVWREVFGVHEAAFARALKRDDLFVEHTLATIASLLALPTERATVGYRYLSPELLEGGIALKFRQKMRPSWEERDPGPARLVDEMPGMVRPARHAVGDVLRLIVSARNTASAGRGVIVRVRGDALPLVEVMQIWVRAGDLLKQRDARPIVPTRVEDTLVADVPDLEIPPGVRHGLTELRDAASFHAAHETIRAAAVTVNVEARARRPGIGSIAIEVSPEGRPGLVVTHEVTIEAPLERPLRARADVESHELRPLAGDEAMIVGVVLDSTRDAAAELARRVFERFVTCGGQKPCEMSVFRSAPGKRPLTKKLKQPTSPKEWAKIAAAIRDEQAVDVHAALDLDRLFVDGPPPMHRDRYGVAVGGCVLPAGRPDDPELPVVIAWTDVSRAKPDDVDALRRALTSLVDDAMRTNGVQAFLTRWGTAPSLLDTTPYESVCGVSGQVTTLRSWATRFLRAVGKQATWLGPTLRGAIDERAVRSVAEVVDLGRALRVEPRAATNDVERALGTILPTDDQHHEAVTAYHRRRV